jgi:hypothetical protein
MEKAAQKVDFATKKGFPAEEFLHHVQLHEKQHAYGRSLRQPTERRISR